MLHDLNLQNLENSVPFFWHSEVSIGHALTFDALEMGYLYGCLAIARG